MLRLCPRSLASGAPTNGVTAQTDLLIFAVDLKLLCAVPVRIGERAANPMHSASICPKTVLAAAAGLSARKKHVVMP
jgi:hypothetical protein